MQRHSKTFFYSPAQPIQMRIDHTTWSAIRSTVVVVIVQLGGCAIFDVNFVLEVDHIRWGGFVVVPELPPQEDHEQQNKNIICDIAA